MGAAVSEIRYFWKLVITNAGSKKILEVSLFSIAASLTEGAALLLLVPLLTAIDQTAGKPGSPWLQKILPDVDSRVMLAIILALFVIVVIIRAAMARRSELTLLALQIKIVRDITVQLYSAIAEASWSFLHTKRSADFHAAATSEMTRLETAVYYALEMPSRAAMLTIHVVIAFFLAPALTSVGMVTGLFIVWLARRYLEESLQLGDKLSESYASLHRQISEFLAGLKITKVFAAEERHIRAFTGAVDEVNQFVFSYTKSAANARQLQEICAGLALVAFIWIGAAIMKLPLSDVLVLALIFYRLLPLFQRLQQSAQEMLHASSAAHTILGLTSECHLAREREMRTSDNVHFHDSLIFKDVRFRYEAQRPEVLRGINFSLKNGSVTVLAGSSGSGKSTIVDLLAGLLRPTHGQILIDDEVLDAAQTVSWRGGVSLVSQESFLFHDTIRSNLLVARPYANDSELKDALKKASLSDFVSKLPNKLETVLASRGASVSGGERQRLALARALLRKPRLLILDEPTSALDKATENEVIKIVERLRGKVTIFIVTHRPEKIDADQILTLDDGKIQVVVRKAEAAVLAEQQS